MTIVKSQWDAIESNMACVASESLDCFRNARQAILKRMHTRSEGFLVVEQSQLILQVLVKHDCFLSN
jgi:hypothetical protein